MFRLKREIITRTQIEIDHCFDELESLDPASDRYKMIVNNLNRLKLGEVDVNEKTSSKRKLDPNTVVTVLTYAGLTVLVVIVEIFGHSITTRAMSVTPFKPKI